MHQVNLVLHEDHGDGGAAALVLHLLLPLLDGVEGGAVDGGEGDHAGLRAAVVGLGDGVELLLAGRVPKHQSHIFRQNPNRNKIIYCQKNLKKL